MKSIISIFFLSSMLFSAHAADSIPSPWVKLDVQSVQEYRTVLGQTWVKPEKYQAVRLEVDALNLLLANVPSEQIVRAKPANSSSIISLPRPNGDFERFEIMETMVMAPELQHWMEEQGWPMKTYLGKSLDNPGTVAHLDWGGPAGFHGMVSGEHGTYYIDPVWKDNINFYFSYMTDQISAPKQAFSCDVSADNSHHTHIRAGASTRGDLRKYRLAVAATGEYTSFHGGTKAQGQAAITTTINRVNQVYERDLSLRLVLVAGNNKIVYTNAVSDPYTGDIATENQTNVDNVIGSANYDMGHVVTVAEGGEAALGSTCVNGVKAMGMTGSPQPLGDPFDVDFVAHEMGHQLGGNHTFNTGTSGSCGGGNRNADTAYEPGSGSTIQGYAGICAPDDLQVNSDDYFHGISLDQILNHLDGTGNCFSTEADVNSNAPTVNAGSDYTIPVNTAFELTVESGSDADGDTLTYVWEQFDLGNATVLSDVDNGSSPILRSWPPTASGVRIIPRLDNLLSNTLPVGEQLPSTDRELTFRVTVRDNHIMGGRVGDDTMVITSTTAAGPFLVTHPNGGETLNGSATVTWNTANTNSGPVNTPNVDILLSTDGGQTFPLALASATANDGSELVTLPSGLASTSARIKVKGRDNIFFDISNAAFTLGSQPPPVAGVNQCSTPSIPLNAGGSVTDTMVITEINAISDLNLTLDIDHTFVGDLTVSLKNITTGQERVVVDRPGDPAIADGCDSADIVVTLDDSASLSVEDQCAASPPAIDGTFKPNNMLSGFNGTAQAGTWQLTVQDEYIADTGTLNEWCIQTMNPAPVNPTLTVNVLGGGSGTVTSSPDGIDCGSQCIAAFAPGTEVTLTAVAASGSRFDGWSGGPCTGTGTCVTAMDNAKSVGANFSQQAGVCSKDPIPLISQASGVLSFSSEDSIVSSGNVTFGAATDITLEAPFLRFSPIFRVEQNGMLRVITGPVECL